MKTSKLCIVIPGPSFEAAKEQIARASLKADLLEFRLDLFNFNDMDQILKLREASSLPVIFKMRGREDNLLKLAQLQPNYLDLEWDKDQSLFVEISKSFPEICVICSFHDMEKTPDNLEDVLGKMLAKPATLYKIATMANSSLDALRMLSFICKTKRDDVIGLCMGESGQITRILGPIFGSPIIYASLDNATQVAPGQLDADILLNIYRIKQLNAKTMVLGLIGNPVQHSVGHQFHNNLLTKIGQDAVYVKCRLHPHELNLFLKDAQELGFKGLSVTMPLKEEILSHLNVDAQTQSIGAVNTVAFSQKGLAGYNTDGLGALLAIQNKMSVNNKLVVILGAGGAAKAIANQLNHQGAKLIILNRNENKARALAAMYNCTGYHLDQFSEIAKRGYDLLINCTSVGMGNEKESPVPLDLLLHQRTVMDIITQPRETALLREAKKKNCQIITGYEMFVQQALLQYAHWFD